jgi:hypothetical protein
MTSQYDGGRLSQGFWIFPGIGSESEEIGWSARDKGR